MPAGPYALHNDQHAYSAYGYGGEKSPSAAAAAAAGYQAPLNGAADESANSILQSVKEQVITLCLRPKLYRVVRRCTWFFFPRHPIEAVFYLCLLCLLTTCPGCVECTVARYIWFMHEMITECKCFSTNHYCMYVYLN